MCARCAALLCRRPGNEIRLSAKTGIPLGVLPERERERERRGKASDKKSAATAPASKSSLNSNSNSSANADANASAGSAQTISIAVTPSSSFNAKAKPKAAAIAIDDEEEEDQGEGDDEGDDEVTDAQFTPCVHIMRFPTGTIGRQLGRQAQQERVGSREESAQSCTSRVRVHDLAMIRPRSGGESGSVCQSTAEEGAQRHV